MKLFGGKHTKKFDVKKAAMKCARKVGSIQVTTTIEHLVEEFLNRLLS